MKKSKYAAPSNRNACIRARSDRSGKLRTETARRDEGSTQFAASTNPKSHATNLFIDFADGSLRLSGAEARTLYRILNKHYKRTGRSY